MALQRMAGNAAVTRVVEADRHSHSAGCLHHPGAGQVPVQRTGGDPDAITPAPAAEKKVDLNSFLGRDVPDYWKTLAWQQESEGVFASFLAQDHPVFRAIEEYARASQRLTPYTAPAGEKTRIGVITRELDDPAKVAALGPQGEAKLRRRKDEGKKNGPPPPQSREMQITAIKVVANPKLWEKYAAKRQMYRQSLSVKDGEGGFEGTGRDGSERVPWSIGQRPDLAGTAAVSMAPGPGPDHRPGPDALPPAGNVKAPASAGEAFFVHGTTPAAITGIQSGGFDLKYVSNRAKDGEPDNWGKLGKGVYMADSTSKAQTYTRCPDPQCTDFDCTDPNHPRKEMLMARGLLGQPNKARIYDKSKRADDENKLKAGRTSIYSPGLKNDPLAMGATGGNEFLFKDVSLLYPEIRIYYQT